VENQKKLLEEFNEEHLDSHLVLTKIIHELTTLRIMVPEYTKLQKDIKDFELLNDELKKKK